MVLSTREKLIAGTLAAAVGLLLADQYAIRPYLDERARVTAQLAAARQKLSEEKGELAMRPRVAQAWAGLTAAGLKSDPAEAESQGLHFLRDAGQAARFDLQSLKPERAGQSGDFQQIRFQAGGVGTTAGVAQLLWYVETASIPLKLNEIRITSRKEGTDDLSLQMSASTLVFSPKPTTKPGVKPAGRATGGPR